MCSAAEINFLSGRQELLEKGKISSLPLSPSYESELILLPPRPSACLCCRLQMHSQPAFFTGWSLSSFPHCISSYLGWMSFIMATLDCSFYSLERESPLLLPPWRRWQRMSGSLKWLSVRSSVARSLFLSSILMCVWALRIEDHGEAYTYACLKMTACNLFCLLSFALSGYHSHAFQTAKFETRSVINRNYTCILPVPNQFKINVSLKTTKILAPSTEIIDFL